MAKGIKHIFLPEDYTILFRLKDKANFLINEFLMEGALSPANPLIIQKNGFWTFYLKKNMLHKLKERGDMLFSSPASFKDYATSFYDYLTYAETVIIPRAEDEKEITANSFRLLVDDLKKLWYFYGFTEAVYSDFVYGKMMKSKNKAHKKTLKDNLATLIDLKAKGRKVFNAYVMQNGIIAQILRMIEGQRNIGEKDASFLTIDELMFLLEGGKIDKQLITKRRKAYVLGLSKGKEFFLDGDDSFKIAEIFQQFEEKEYKKADKGIKGTTANPGRAKGKVIIAPMLDKAEADKVALRMKKGDILVVQSTNPDLIVLCKKAAAIVTNQGGMLSHAAIISRELKIPCIVGTIIATKVLKEGDFVEVNAEKGLVTKMKSQRN